MENNKKTLTSAIALSAIIATFGVTAFTNAHFGGFGLDSEQRDALKTAVEEGDYNSWKEIHETLPKVADLITENNFDQYSEMHNLIQEGNFEEADAIREKLGLPEKGHGRSRGAMQGMREGRGDRGGFNNLGLEAIESGDFDAWKETVGETRMGELIETEEDFQKLIEAHNLLQEGDYEGAQEIKEKLGFELRNDHRGAGMIGERMGGKWQGRISE